MMSTWRFGSIDTTSRPSCRVGMIALTVALLAAVGCSGNLASSPTSLSDDIVNSVGTFSLSGRVFDDDTDDAIKGALVSIERSAGPAEALTDVNGAYRFEGLGGVVVIRARGRGYASTDGVAVRMNRDVEMNFVLLPDADDDDDDDDDRPLPGRQH